MKNMLFVVIAAIVAGCATIQTYKSPGGTFSVQSTGKWEQVKTDVDLSLIEDSLTLVDHKQKQMVYLGATRKDKFPAEDLCFALWLASKNAEAVQNWTVSEADKSTLIKDACEFNINGSNIYSRMLFLEKKNTFFLQIITEDGAKMSKETRQIIDSIKEN